MIDRKAQHEILRDPEFLDLVARKNRISLILTILTLAVYYGFIFLIAFNKEFFGRKITSRITIGIPIGIGVILLAWVFTGIYVRWANRRYDGMVESVRGKIEERNAALPANGAGRN